MSPCFTPLAWEEYLYWQANDRQILKRINLLIKDIQRNPEDKEGLGKPELLKGEFSGFASRRITDEHRLVYKIKDGKILIVQCRFHYR